MYENENLLNLCSVMYGISDLVLNSIIPLCCLGWIYKLVPVCFSHRAVHAIMNTVLDQSVNEAD